MPTGDDDPLDEYVLSAQFLTDGEPVRCVATSAQKNESSLELLSGSQGGVVSRIVLPSVDTEPSANEIDDCGSGRGTFLEIQPGGADTRHPYHITAILSSSSLSNAASNIQMSPVYVTGCKDGNVRVIDGNSHGLKFVLSGHSNAVTSLSWILGETIGSGNNAAPWLISGSWDGAAKIWHITEKSYLCLGTLSGHENTVSVAGLPADSDRIRRAVTVSAGVAEGNVIRGHTVRVWCLTLSSDGTAIKSELVAQVANDHSGPMRDVVYDPETHSTYTCSNDGTVKIRSAEDGSCSTTLAYPGKDRPMFLSLCVVGDWKTKAVVAGAEDGNVVIWDVSSNCQNRESQVIAHPGCVWRVASLTKDSADFVTACNDGYIRTFTRHSSRSAPSTILESFSNSVQDAMTSRSTGPTSDEIAKLPLWEMNAVSQGRSEGQVQVFQKDGKAIAAQWSAVSRTWIEVGEVTGTNPNAGTLDGKRYDHVLPIEIDVPGGGVQKLQIGYNNGENPFVTAQTFIDEHMLDQGYLAQIADYIRQRAGESKPTLGMVGNRGCNSSHAPTSSGTSAPTPMEATPTYDHLPMKGYKIFDSGIDKKGLTRVLTKIREFNNLVPSNALSPNEANGALDSLAATLSITNRYHSSTVSDIELATIHKMVTNWGVKEVFPALDLARMAVLHPDASAPKRESYWNGLLCGALDMCLGLGDGASAEVAVPMLTMRLVANSYRGGGGSAAAAGALADSILVCANACAPSNNKNVRLSVATAILNTSSYMHYSSSSPLPSCALRVFDVFGTVAGCGNYESEPIVRSLIALGTVLLLPGGCGAEIMMVAKEKGIESMVVRASGGHGDKAKAVAREIQGILLR